MIATSREYMASQIRAIREKRGISAKELADAIGNSVKTVHAWERGLGQPDADKLVQICNVLKVDVSAFYDPSLVGSKSADYEDPRTHELTELFNAMTEESRDALVVVARALACSSQGACNEH